MALGVRGGGGGVRPDNGLGLLISGLVLHHGPVLAQRVVHLCVAPAYVGSA